MKYLRKYRYELIAIVACLILGRLSGLSVSYGDHQWYESLIKPSFNPPSWVFPPVWTLLYILMGITFGKLFKDRQYDKKSLILFSVQFVLNLLWSPLYFYLERIDLALIDICIMWFCLMLFMIRTRKQLFKLNMPYALWLSFALILNICIYVINS